MAQLLKSRLITPLPHKKSKSMDELYVFSLPIEESEIIDFFLEASLKDEGLKISNTSAEADLG